jgi:hypothetical protein
LDFDLPETARFWLILKFAHAQDGLLRVFHYDSMELVGAARSYFGGLLCAAWSPDGKYIVAGGEDDLVTVYRYSGIKKLCVSELKEIFLPLCVVGVVGGRKKEEEGRRKKEEGRRKKEEGRRKEE